jgi:hypothetical protein
MLLRGRRCAAGWVVKKDSCRTVCKCRVLSGSIGRSGWSDEYRQLTAILQAKPTVSSWVVLTLGFPSFSRNH